MSNTYVGDIPGDHTFQVQVPAHAAATATEYAATWEMPFKGRLKSSRFIPNGAATGDNTNRTNLNIINAGTAGTGTTEIANHDLATGSDLASGVPVEFTIATAPLSLEAGVKLRLQQEKVSSGVAVPSGTWVIVIDGAG